MLFPESERYVFAKNPLAEVICQLRFPSILSIASKTPADFQEEIRRDYPLYSREEAQLPPEVASLLGEGLIPTPPEAITHRFATEDARQQVALTVNFLAITDVDYVHWTDFWGRIEPSVAALQRVYEPSFFSRVGLRYRDVIDRDELGVSDMDWSELLIPEFTGTLGTPGDLRRSVQAFKTETVLQIEQPSGGQVRIQGGLGRLTDGESSEGRDVFIFDADFFTETRTEHHELPDTLERFNRMAGNLFRWVITPALRDALGRSDDTSA